MTVSSPIRAFLKFSQGFPTPGLSARVNSHANLPKPISRLICLTAHDRHRLRGLVCDKNERDGTNYSRVDLAGSVCLTNYRDESIDLIESRPDGSRFARCSGQ